MTTDPLSPVYAKLSAGVNSAILTLGDSTVNGVGCSNYQGGWCYHLARKIAADLDVNARIYVYSGVFVQTATFTTTRSGAPWLSVYDSGILSAKITNQYAWMNYSTSSIRADADLVIIGQGINDLRNGESIPTYIADFDTWITNIKSRLTGTGVPFVVTTENPVNESANANYSNIAAGFQALATSWASATLPLNTVVPTSITDTWFVDTRSAYGSVYQASMLHDDVHPNCAGYTSQGEWLFDRLKTAYTAALTNAPTITTSSLAELRRDVSFTQTITATGATPITFAVQSGALPTGLTLASSTGVISGTPTTAGNYSFTIRATNSYGTADQVFSGTVGIAPTVTTTTLGEMKTGTAVSITLASTGTAPIAWSIKSGYLPAGLTLSGSGVLFGTPTAAGAYTVTVRATNAYGTADQVFTGTVTAQFTANSYVKPKIKLGGKVYPITIKAKTGGVVRRALPRNGAI